jgi:2-polyprenyl-3-methyl-5-hydroxy-6-metoxy-1,4-benzoquinol methylase
MRDTGEFYEEYWQWRRTRGHLNQRIPERLHAALRLLGAPPPRLLDIGCGEGTLGRMLRERGARHLTGVDLAAGALELAQAHYDTTLQANIEREHLAARLGGAQFDAIVALEVLEHLFAPRAALAQFHELLAPGGAIIVSFPNSAWWRYRLELLRGRFPEEYHVFDAVEHLQQFTLPSFTRLLVQAGFRITAIDGEFLQPPGVRHLPSPLRRALNRRLPNLFGYQIVVRAEPADAR